VPTGETNVPVSVHPPTTNIPVDENVANLPVAQAETREQQNQEEQGPEQQLYLYLNPSAQKFVETFELTKRDQTHNSENVGNKDIINDLISIWH
jgi:hypothetical protein